jgi:hypothetical protein
MLLPAAAGRLLPRQRGWMPAVTLTAHVLIISVSQVSNVAASCRGALAASSARLDASRCALQGELQATLAQFDAVMDGTGELQVEVVDEVRQVLCYLLCYLLLYLLVFLESKHATLGQFGVICFYFCSKRAGHACAF